MIFLKIIQRSLIPYNILLTFEKMSTIKLCFKLDFELRLHFEIIRNSADFVPSFKCFCGISISYRFLFVTLRAFLFLFFVHLATLDTSYYYVIVYTLWVISYFFLLNVQYLNQFFFEHCYWFKHQTSLRSSWIRIFLFFNKVHIGQIVQKIVYFFWYELLIIPTFW